MYRYPFRNWRPVNANKKPSLDELISLLSGLRLTDSDPDAVDIVAYYLVLFTTESQPDAKDVNTWTLVNESASRLWDYWGKKDKNVDPKAAAREAILKELSVLDQLLNGRRTVPRQRRNNNI